MKYIEKIKNASLKDKLVLLGVPIYVLFLAVMLALDYAVYKVSGVNGDSVHLSIKDILLVPALTTLGYDIIEAFAGGDTFTGNNGLSSDTKEKRKAMHPAIPAKYLSREPLGFIWGKYRNQYVRTELDPKAKDYQGIMHAMIIGGSGSGKSSGPILSTLLTMLHKPYVNFFVMDIKPELARKSYCYCNEPDILTVNPTNRMAAGWDVYYALTEDMGDDAVLRYLDPVVHSLIPSPADERNAFFYNSSRDILKAALLYYYRCGKGFIDSISLVMSSGTQDLVQSILSDTIHCPKGSKVQMLLQRFAGKDSQAMQDIEMTLAEKLGIFALDDIRYFLRDNPIKASAMDVASGAKSVFLVLPEDRLEELKDLVRLISTQVVKAIEMRTEDAPKTTVVILDELGKIGRIPNLEGMLATCRSKRCSVVIAVQDISQLEVSYGKETARTLVNLAEITNVLSCRDSASAKMICDWAGTYRETQVSTSSKDLITAGNSTISKAQRNVLEPSDLMHLQERGEELLYIKGTMYCPQKIYYFKDPGLAKLSAAIEALNAQVAGTCELPV